MAIKTMAELKEIFKGVSSFRWANTVQTSIASAAWEYELPIATDSFNLTQAAGTLNPTKVFGLAGAWTVSGEQGDVTIDIFLPTIHDDLMKIFYSQTAAELETADETKGSVTGSYKGYGYKLNNEMLEGSAMIVSEDGKKALFLRNVQGFPSLVYDSPLDTPMGVNLNLQLVGGDPEADMAFLEWTPAV